MLTVEMAKSACINAIESYMQTNKIKYSKMESKSGSIYYELELYNGNPKIRVSDHPFRYEEEYKLCSLNINYVDDFGKNSNPKKVKVRVHAMVEKLIRNHTLYHIHKVFKQMDATTTSGKGNDSNSTIIK